MEPSFSELLAKYLSGTLSAEERGLLADSLRETDHLAALEQIIDKDFREDHIQSLGTAPQSNLIYNRILGQMTTTSPVPVIPIRRSLLKWAAIAALFILLFGGAYLAVFHKSAVPLSQIAAKPAIGPGGNKATLTLSNGTKIILDSAATGLLTHQGNIQIIKSDSGLLAYQGKPGQTQTLAYNTLTTPKGGQFQVTLPDGTHVWLNSASSLRYPAAFPAAGNRTVELTGEGYFEVARDKAKPFEVRVGEQTIQVLGTSFNIMAYAEEGPIKTTLLEGGVKVSFPSLSGEKFLSPGQQASLNESGTEIKITRPDLEEVIAWKNGRFLFTRTDIRTIMRQLARWYNIDVVYQGDPSGVYLFGMVSRRKSIGELLQIFEQTGKVHFNITGNTITVIKN